MMDPDELEDAVTALETWRDQQKQDMTQLQRDHTQLRREYDLLANKLRYPGTKFLVDLEYKLVYDTTLTVPSSPTYLVSPVFETLPGRLHAVYALSAYPVDSNVDIVVCDGWVLGPLGTLNSGVSIAIARQRQAAPLRIEHSVVINNSAGISVDIAIRIWRRLGMGS
jgi:hypothetical protein